MDSIDPEGDDMRHSRAIQSALDDLFKREDEGTAFKDGGVETIPLGELGKWMVTGKYKCLATRGANVETSSSSSSTASSNESHRTSPPVLRSWSGFGEVSPRGELSGDPDSSRDWDSVVNRSSLDQGNLAAPKLISEGMEQISRYFLTYVDDATGERSLYPNPDMTMRSGSSVVSAISGLEELAISLDENIDDIVDRVVINDHDDFKEETDEVNRTSESSTSEMNTLRHPGTNDQVLGGGAKGEPTRQEHPGTIDQVMGGCVQGEQSRQGDVVHNVIPAGGESDFEEEAALSSFFADITDSSYVFNDSVEVFLAKNNESQIVTVSTSESSGASVTSPGVQMNEAFAAEYEGAPEDGFDEDDLEEDDLPDLIEMDESNNLE